MAVVRYEGGPGFRDQYLQEFSKREEPGEYSERKSITPIPSFAKSALADIRNAIFQRMVDIVRKDGSEDVSPRDCRSRHGC